VSVDVAPAPRAATEFVGRPRQLVQLLRAGSTTPERLRRVAAGLVVGCLLTALTSVLGGLAHTDAVHDSGTRIAALDSDAAELYRSLADADATATRGYVSGGLEPRCGAGALRRRRRARGRPPGTGSEPAPGRRSGGRPGHDDQRGSHPTLDRDPAGQFGVQRVAAVASVRHVGRPTAHRSPVTDVARFTRAIVSPERVHPWLLFYQQ
jgi:hypothetical protein